MSFKELLQPGLFIFDNHEVWYVGVDSDELEYLHKDGLIKCGTSGLEALAYLTERLDYQDHQKMSFDERIKMYGGYYHTLEDAASASEAYYKENNEEYPYY